MTIMTQDFLGKPQQFHSVGFVNPLMPIVRLGGGCVGVEAGVVQGDPCVLQTSFEIARPNAMLSKVSRWGSLSQETSLHF